MGNGFLSTPAGTATLVALAGAALVLPLFLPESLGGSFLDLAGRCVVLAVVVLMGTRRRSVATRVALGAAGMNPAPRSRFEDALGLELARLQRFSRPFALVSIHCEGLAARRERAGGRGGEEVLETAAQVIDASLRRTDFSAAVDRESFGVLLPETDASTAGIVADQLRERLAHAMRAKHWPASFSVGVSVFTQPVDSVDAAVARVAELMSRVRQRGRNGMLIETDGVRQREAHPELA